ncbi:NAD dehydrogenase [Rhizoctonia solani AG-1 IA]|uniref:L-2-hydroxyglutarate dehydrogenase, mitochondrial n=1 Tax=Thanatephorus cucumeris (strain AG1-IA) TaxID=983506 RepID=L8WUI5_THACA|nr:NAD dehydrogenase [Rhizoctonia solani AG-1 IA]
MEVDTQTTAPVPTVLPPIAQGGPGILTESMGLGKHMCICAQAIADTNHSSPRKPRGHFVRATAVVSIRSQTVLLDFAIAEAGKRRDRHVYVNAPNPKATSGSPHPRLHCFKFQTEKHAFQLEKRLMALANRDPVAAISRYLPSHKTATPEQIQRARANYASARLKQLQESGIHTNQLEFPDSYGLHWVSPVRASSAKPRVHPYATVTKERKPRKSDANADSTARALAEALAATSITPTDQLERGDNVQSSIFGPLPPPPPAVKWGGFAEFGPRHRSAATSKEITPDPTTESRVSQDFVTAFASQTLQDTEQSDSRPCRRIHPDGQIGLCGQSRGYNWFKPVCYHHFVDLIMVSLLRTLRSIRRVGMKEYIRQMWYIGDAKSGRFVGGNRFGNRYFENTNAEEELPGVYGHFDNLPPDWHSWLHHIRSEPPTTDKIMHESTQPWQQYLENLTGTRGAYRPYNTAAPKITAWDPKTRLRPIISPQRLILTTIVSSWLSSKSVPPNNLSLGSINMSIRGLAVALNSNGRYAYRKPEMAVDHLVIGAGVVGLAIAQRLAYKFPDKSTYLVERNSRVGEETRMKELPKFRDHLNTGPGLYYPTDSLKTRLCLRGRHLLYGHCDKHKVPYRKTGKLIVARKGQEEYLNKLHAHAKALKWPPFSNPDSSKSPVAPTRLISGDEARQLEPDLSREITAAIESPETGILDSHSFFESLEKFIDESNGAGTVALGTKVVRVDPYVPQPGDNVDGLTSGWVVQFLTGDSGEPDSILTHTLVNASGLSSTLVLNALLPLDKRLTAFFSRGSYASYRGPGTSHISRLIYPVPEQSTSHGHASLGTHLTVDMEGNIKFGPDAEWLQPPEDMALDGQETHDFWKRHLIPSDSRLEQMYHAVLTYLPDIRQDGLSSDYVGIRPKLVGPGHGFQDFVIRQDWSTDFYSAEANSRSGRMISLLGIESPGLTSSLAIGEMVVEELI